MRGLLLGVFALTTQVVEPDGDARRVTGVVVQADGTRVPGADVRLTCADWRASVVTGVDGGFLFDAVPDGPCLLRVETATMPGDELPVPVGATDLGRVQIPPRHTDTPGSPRADDAPAADSPPGTSSLDGQRLRVRGDTPAPVLPPPTSGWTVRGSASWNGDTALAPPGPDGWRAEVQAERSGPLGLRYLATSRVRRQLGASTLLNDVTGTDTPGDAAWSSLFDPTSSPTIWDVRFRVERTFSVGGAEVTPFGEGYYSFQRHLAPDAPATAASAAGQTMRTGSAVRAGIKIGF